MGQIAEDMSDGTCCELCGQYFQDNNDSLYTHGYPVTCWDCWRGLDKKEKQLYQRAKVETI
jgi:hypothetical protein